jgi:hypothetical protein
MQNEISAVALKPDFLGKVFASGESSTRQIYLNGARRQYRAYSVTSDNVLSFTILAPVGRSEMNVGLFEELILKNPKLVPLQSSIGQGQNRNRYYEYFILVDGISVKGGK